MTAYVDVVLTRGPGPDSEFVELEDDQGRGVGAAFGAEWVNRGDGYAVLRIPLARCCDLHGRACEPPSELCCERCTEATHPGHPDGSTCSAPDMSQSLDR